MAIRNTQLACEGGGSHRLAGAGRADQQQLAPGVEAVAAQLA
jgi:hypothetical protein